MLRFASLASFALLLSSCDPGFHVTPVGWQQIRSRRFERQVGDLHIQTSTVGGLAGEWWIGVDFLITDAKAPVIPKAITLVTSHGRFPGKLRDTPHSLPADALSAPGRALLAADWQFPRDTTLPRILSGSVTVEVSFLYGGYSRSFAVTYGPEQV